LAGVAEAVYQFHGLMFVGEVERYDEAVFLGGGHGFSLTALRSCWGA
jgi:hypothetical protein